MTAVRAEWLARPWRLWIGLSIVVAFGVAFVSVGLFGSFDGAVIAFGGGLWWDAAAPRVIRAIGRRWA